MLVLLTAKVSCELDRQKVLEARAPWNACTSKQALFGSKERTSIYYAYLPLPASLPAGVPFRFGYSGAFNPSFGIQVKKFPNSCIAAVWNGTDAGDRCQFSDAAAYLDGTQVREGQGRQQMRLP